MAIRTAGSPVGHICLRTATGLMESSHCGASSVATRHGWSNWSFWRHQWCVFGDIMASGGGFSRLLLIALLVSCLVDLFQALILLVSCCWCCCELRLAFVKRFCFGYTLALWTRGDSKITSGVGCGVELQFLAMC